MKDNNKLIRVFTGTEIAINLLKDELENAGISGIIKNDFNSGISAGFMGDIPSAIDLFIQKTDLKKAEPIIYDFMLINNKYQN